MGCRGWGRGGGGQVFGGTTPAFKHSSYFSFHSFVRIKERTFSSQEFQANNVAVQPWSFCFYQTQWNASVHQTYMNTLGRHSSI